MDITSEIKISAQHLADLAGNQNGFFDRGLETDIYNDIMNYLESGDDIRIEYVEVYSSLDGFLVEKDLNVVPYEDGEQNDLTFGVYDYVLDEKVYDRRFYDLDVDLAVINTPSGGSEYSITHYASGSLDELNSAFDAVFLGTFPQQP